MKLTKEKVIYFVSLNMLPSLVAGFIFYKMFLTGGYAIYHVEEFFEMNRYFIFILFGSLPILLSSLVAFLYAYKKSDEYKIIICSLLTGVTLPIAWFIIFFDGLEFLMDDFFDLVFGFGAWYLMTVIISLIVLGITNPLRKKIKW